jgi:hypothetical protein
MIRGINLARGGELAEARDALLLSIEHEHGGAAAELQLLGVLEKLDDVPGVIDLTGRMLARGVSSPMIGTVRSRALSDAGRYDEAAAASS